MKTCFEKKQVFLRLDFRILLSILLLKQSIAHQASGRLKDIFRRPEVL